MSHTFKTNKGTELPLLALKGKDYLQVPYRVQWCREEHPDWAFVTEFVQRTDDFAVVKATVLNEQGKVVATAHKREDRNHFADYLEKAETGALGRALAYCGYGTQYAVELIDSDERIADAPLAGVDKPQEAAVIDIASRSGSGASTMRARTGPSEKQINRLYAIVKKSRWSEEDVAEMLSKVKKARVEDFSIREYDLFCDYVEKHPK